MNIINLFRPSRWRVGLDEPADLNSWRNWFVNVMIIFAAFGLPISFAATFPIFIAEERYGLMAFDVGLWLFVIIRLFIKGSPYLFRAYFWLAILYIMTITFYIALGPHYARSAWLVMCAVMAALMFGSRAAAVSSATNAAMLMLLYWLIGPENQAWASTYAMPFGKWVMFVSNISMITLLSSLPVGFLLNKLDRAFRDESDARKKLSAESKMLHSAHIELQSEVAERKRAEKDLKEAYDIISRSPAVAFLWKNDEEWPVEFVTDNVEAIFGYTAEEFISGKVTYTKTVHPDDLERVAQEVATYNDEEGRKTFTHEPYRIVAKDGKVKWIEDRTYITKDKKGKITHYQGIVEDISDRKLAEDELKYQKKHLESLIRYSSLAIVTLEDNHNIISCNRYFEDLFQFKESEILNKNLDELISGQKYLEDARAYTRKTREGEAIHGSGKRYRKDGTSIDVEFFGVPVIVDGKIVGAYGIYQDIGERKRAEEALRKAHEELEQRVEERTAELSAQVEEIEKLNRAMNNLLDDLGAANKDLQQEIAERKWAEKALLASELKFRTLHESSRDAVMVLDEEKFIDCNNATLEIFGCASREEFCGKHASELSPPTQPDGRDSRGLADERIATAFKKGSSFFEWLHRRMDGTDFPAEVLLSAMELEDKPVLQAVVRDITERKRAEEELRKYREKLEKLVQKRTAKLEKEVEERKRAEADMLEAHQRYQAVFHSKTNLVFVIDNKADIIDANDSALDLFGYTREELGNVNYLQLLHPDQSLEAVADVLKETSETGVQAEPLEIKLKSKNGKAIYLQSGGALIPGKTEIIGVARDMTDQKMAEVANQELEDQLRQAQKMEAIGTLAGGIAHDFNNILGAIIGYTELTLYDVADNEKVRRRLEKVLQSGERARDLVQRILTFTRQTDKERSPVRVSPIIKEALKLLRATLPTTIQIHEHIEAKADLILGDPVQVHQILMNLCTNAKHAMHKRGGVLEVRLTDVTLDSEETVGHLHLHPGHFLKIQVSDTGDGMSSDIMERIFDPYFTTKAKGEGTGLGLSVVHGIVEDHGGAVDISSEVGKGTIFKILLPVSEDQGEVKQKPEKPLLRGTENILLVDDEELLVDVYSKMLERLGYQVVTKTSSTEALEIFGVEPERFDLVLTDYTMPNMTGIQLAEELLKIRSDIPIILYSGFTEDITPGQAKKRGIKEMLSKPLIIHELSKVLRQYLS